MIDWAARPRWSGTAQIGLLALWTLGMVVGSWISPIAWTWFMPVIGLALGWRALMTPPLWALDGTRLLRYKMDEVQTILLPEAEVSLSGGRVTLIRMVDGRPERFDLCASPAMREAIMAARAGTPAGAPPGATLMGFARPAVPAWRVLSGIAALMALSVATLAWQQPLFLLPLAGLPYLFSPTGSDQAYVLTPEGIWVAAPGAAPLLVSWTVVRSVSRPGDMTVTVATDHPYFPVLKVNSYQGADFLRKLRRRMAAGVTAG